MSLLHRDIPCRSEYRIPPDLVRPCGHQYPVLPGAHLCTGHRSRDRSSGGRNRVPVHPEVVFHARDFNPRQLHDLLGHRLLPGAGVHGVLPPAVCRAPLQVRAVLVLLGHDPSVCLLCCVCLHHPGSSDWEEI